LEKKNERSNPLEVCKRMCFICVSPSYNMPRFSPTSPRGFSKAHLRRTRVKFGIKHMVEIHHVLPREFKKHPCVIANGYNVEADYNTILLPSKRGSYLSTRRPIHTGGHVAYNRFVADGLNVVSSSPCAFIMLLTILFKGSRGTMHIPWRSTVQ